MAKNLPTTLSNYLINIKNEGISRKESEALDKLKMIADINVIDQAVDSLLRNGIPPYGKVCIHPLSELVRNTKILNLFCENISTPATNKPPERPSPSAEL